MTQNRTRFLSVFKTSFVVKHALLLRVIAAQARAEIVVGNQLNPGTSSSNGAGSDTVIKDTPNADARLGIDRTDSSHIDATSFGNPGVSSHRDGSTAESSPDPDVCTPPETPSTPANCLLTLPFRSGRDRLIFDLSDESLGGTACRIAACGGGDSTRWSPRAAAWPPGWGCAVPRHLVRRA